MRLTPSVLGIFPRTILPGGFEIDGRFIREGTEVGVCTYSVHHNPKCFPEPFEYRSERWLHEGEELEVVLKTSRRLVWVLEDALGRGWRICRL
jgi:cytochrome P450